MTGPAGYADLQLHQFADLAFGGKVLWGSSADDDRLGDCRPLHGPHGLRDLPGNLGRMVVRTMSARSLLGHRTAGAPAFADWPAWSDVTHQAAPLSALRRAVDGGLRLIVMLAVNNELLGRLTRGDGYADMTAVNRQLQAAKDFEAMVDRMHGGPGRGWYRIAYTPGQARRTIENGDLAVVVGTEVDDLFGGVLGPDPTPADLAAEVDRYHALGVRHVLPIHLKDCRYGGAAFATGLHWSRDGGVLSRVNPFGSLPVYRMHTATRTGGYDYRAGHCNSQGLTPLGEELIRLLMDRGVMIDVDHMAAASRQDTLRLTGAAGYPVVAGHAEAFGAAPPGTRSERMLTDAELAAIHRHGGMVGPVLRQTSVTGTAPGTAQAFLSVYRHVLTRMPGAPVAFGTDLNGFAGLPRPSGGPGPAYPFTAPVTGTEMGHSRLGGRTYDLATDGVAHVGMLPDLIASLPALGMTAAESEPLLHSAIGYVEAWERAVAAGGALP